ncbi:MAG: hypothetical protein GC137_00270 [Alphaproteobacteria bacterium]|nr:hypothetical protein [Alphaproteobacteria bacterium]
MSTPNKLYNPHWEELYNFHELEKDKLSEQISAWYKNYPAPSNFSELHALEEKRDYHNQICLRCLDTYKHRTVQEYINWAIENQPILKEILEKDYASHISFDHCHSIEHATIMISALLGLQRKVDFLKGDRNNRSSSTVEADSLGIFEDTGSNTLTTSWLNFTTTDRVEEYDFIILTTVDTRDNEKHICFYADEDATRKVGMVMGHIGQIALQFIKNDLGHDFKKLNKKRLKSMPKYHFYTHTIMSSAEPREDFMEHIFEYDHKDIIRKIAGSHARLSRKTMKPHRAVPAFLKDAVEQYIGFDGICLKNQT